MGQAPAVAMRQGCGTKAPNAADLAHGIREILTVRTGYAISLVAVQRRSRYEVQLRKASSLRRLLSQPRCHCSSLSGSDSPTVSHAKPGR